MTNSFIIYIVTTAVKPTRQESTLISSITLSLLSLTFLFIQFVFNQVHFQLIMSAFRENSYDSYSHSLSPIVQLFHTHRRII